MGGLRPQAAATCCQVAAVQRVSAGFDTRMGYRSVVTARLRVFTSGDGIVPALWQETVTSTHNCIENAISPQTNVDSFSNTNTSTEHRSELQLKSVLRMFTSTEDLTSGPLKKLRSSKARLVTVVWKSLRCNVSDAQRSRTDLHARNPPQTH